MFLLAPVQAADDQLAALAAQLLHTLFEPRQVVLLGRGIAHHADLDPVDLRLAQDVRAAVRSRIDGSKVVDPRPVQGGQGVLIARQGKVHAVVVHGVDHVDPALRQHADELGLADHVVLLVGFKGYLLGQHHLEVGEGIIVFLQIVGQQGEGIVIAVFVDHAGQGRGLGAGLARVADAQVAQEREHHAVRRVSVGGIRRGRFLDRGLRRFLGGGFHRFHGGHRRGRRGGKQEGGQDRLRRLPAFQGQVRRGGAQQHLDPADHHLGRLFFRLGLGGAFFRLLGFVSLLGFLRPLSFLLGLRFAFVFRRFFVFRLFLLLRVVVRGFRGVFRLFRVAGFFGRRLFRYGRCFRFSLARHGDQEGLGPRAGPGDLALAQVDRQRRADANVHAGVGSPAQVAVIADQLQLVARLAADGRGPVGGRLRALVHIAAPLDIIGGAGGLPVREVFAVHGAVKAEICVGELLGGQAVELPELPFHQRVPEGFVREQGFHHLGIHPGAQVAVRVGINAPVGPRLDHGLVRLVDHLVRVQHLVGQHQGLTVFHGKHPPQYLAHRAVRLVGVYPHHGVLPASGGLVITANFLRPRRQGQHQAQHQHQSRYGSFVQPQNDPSFLSEKNLFYFTPRAICSSMYWRKFYREGVSNA